MTGLPVIPSFKLTGKKALVVGASSGIGLASACALASEGASITLASRRSKNLEKISNEMSLKGWVSNCLEMDILDIESTKTLVRDNGPFDILVNSAGLARHSKMVDTTLEDFDDVMNVNLRGAYFLTQSVAMGLLKASKPGSLINISSQMAHVGGPIRSVYNMTKAGLEGLTRGMAIDLAKNNIRVNTVCPTFIVTPMTKKFLKDKKFKRNMLSNIPLGRFAQTNDVATAVAFLASDSSSMITGTSILIDGGWTAI